MSVNASHRSSSHSPPPPLNMPRAKVFFDRYNNNAAAAPVPATAANNKNNNNKNHNNNNNKNIKKNKNNNKNNKNKSSIQDSSTGNNKGKCNFKSSKPFLYKFPANVANVLCIEFGKYVTFVPLPLSPSSGSTPPLKLMVTDLAQENIDLKRYIQQLKTSKHQNICSAPMLQ